MEITYKDFRKVQIRVGTVLSLKQNENARQPALVLEVDFGEKMVLKQHLRRLPIIIIQRT